MIEVVKINWNISISLYKIVIINTISFGSIGYAALCFISINICYSGCMRLSLYFLDINYQLLIILAKDGLSTFIVMITDLKWSGQTLSNFCRRKTISIQAL